MRILLHHGRDGNGRAALVNADEDGRRRSVRMARERHNQMQGCAVGVQRAFQLPFEGLRYRGARRHLLDDEAGPVRVSAKGNEPLPCWNSPDSALASADSVPRKRGSPGTPFIAKLTPLSLTRISASGKAFRPWAGIPIAPSTCRRCRRDRQQP